MMDLFLTSTQLFTSQDLKALVSNSIPGGPQLAELSSNQLQITPAWKFLVILKTLISWIRCVWLGLELNCAELWPSRNWVWDQCLKGIVHPKMKNSVINYSPSCQSDPVRPSFIFRIQIKMLLIKSHNFLTQHKHQRNWHDQGPER